MLSKIAAIGLAFAIALSLSSCGSTSKSNFNTSAMKKFVQNSKKKESMSYERKKKLKKSLFSWSD